MAAGFFPRERVALALAVCQQVKSRDLLRYKDRRGNSGVHACKAGPNFIIAESKSSGGYRYDYAKPGRRHVEAMKKLANAGHGPATYINRNVRDNGAKKLW